MSDAYVCPPAPVDPLVEITRQRDEAVRALYEIKRLLSFSCQNAVPAAAAEANLNQAWHVAVLAIDSAEARP